MFCDHKIFFSPAGGVFLFMGSGYIVNAFRSCCRKVFYGAKILCSCCYIVFSLFVPALACFLGECSESRRAFETVYLLICFLLLNMPSALFMLPVTLYTNEHKLLMVNATSGISEIVFSEFNSNPIDTVSVINTDVYMLSTKKDDVTAICYVRKYNENTGNMDICIEKTFTATTGEQIAAFAYGNENIYVLVNNMETENGAYIEVYDDKNFDLSVKLCFDSELENFVSDNGIVEFYCFGNYI